MQQAVAQINNKQMKYIVTRTSEHRREKPCDEAFKHPHQKEYIIGSKEDKMEWTIDIKSLEELNAFAKKYGELVITPESNSCKSPEIEIYDDYRE